MPTQEAASRLGDDKRLCCVDKCRTRRVDPVNDSYPEQRQIMKNHRNPYRPKIGWVGILPAACCFIVVASGQGDRGSPATRGTGLDLTRHTIDGGGVMFSTGGDLELSGTIGQPDAGVMGGGDFTLTGGFWFALAPMDCNEDGGVNLFDYDAFEVCLSGPNGGLISLECACFDLDRNGTVDLQDFGGFQRAFSGS